MVRTEEGQLAVVEEGSIHGFIDDIVVLGCGWSWSPSDMMAVRGSCID